MRVHVDPDAVNASGNNDRVVVMPGIYTEPKSRAAPTNDPKCDGLEEMNDRSDGMGGLQTGALSYAYQFTCPNDQNLIAIMGRQPQHDQVEQPPLDDRHGIPDAGACIRCNLQLEGSGVNADDVVIDAGRVASGNGPTSRAGQGRHHPGRPRRRLRASQPRPSATPPSTTSTCPRSMARCWSSSRPSTTASTGCSPSSPTTT